MCVHGGMLQSLAEWVKYKKSVLWQMKIYSCNSSSGHLRWNVQHTEWWTKFYTEYTMCCGFPSPRNFLSVPKWDKRRRPLGEINMRHLPGQNTARHKASQRTLWNTKRHTDSHRSETWKFVKIQRNMSKLFFPATLSVCVGTCVNNEVNQYVILPSHFSQEVYLWHL